MPRRATPTPAGGFTLVELLVVVGIIGVLASLLLPAVQASREASRRAACASKLRQLGIAAQNHVSTRGALPAGTLAKPLSGDPRAAWSFYRWSAVALLLPYLEGGAEFAAIDFERPLYGSDLNVTEENVEIVATVLPELLCPSDLATRVTPEFGPTNYAACTGSGGAQGSPRNPDGLFGVNSAVRPAEIVDGLSKTALLAESLLGLPGEAPHDPAREYRFMLTHRLSGTGCNGAPLWNVNDPRGFSWAGGEFRTTLYNHHDTPNSQTADCIGVLLATSAPDRQYTPYGWRAARSAHPGGVNLVKADSSTDFAADNVDAQVWLALATRAAGD